MGEAPRSAGDGVSEGLHDPGMPLPEETAALWELNATWWQESFTEGTDPEYTEQIIPLLLERLAPVGRGRFLDVGCGEGQLSRVVARSPSATPRQVVGLDPTPAQLRVALERQPAVGMGLPGYVRGKAEALPFPDASFDAAFACLVFEHIEQSGRALGEVGRVLRTGGIFLLFLNHPLLQAPGSGWVDDHILGEQYWRIGPYLPEHHGVEEVDKNVWVPFVHRPLSAYINAMASAGLYLTAMLEPAPPPGFLQRAEEYEAAAAFPRLLVLQARKSVVGSRT